jgi:hypothetical protein
MKKVHHLPEHQLMILFILAGMVILTMGCNLFSTEYWVHRLNTPEEYQGADSVTQGGQSELSPDSPMAYAEEFGVRCIDAPGLAPCPMEACVVSAGQYTAEYEITSELYGKANPSDFSCCAKFQFIPAGEYEMMTFTHWVTQTEDNWYTNFYAINQSKQPAICSNYYAQKDGIVTRWLGITEIIVLYANPHCEWIHQNEPGLEKYRIPISGPCVPQE